jgi:Tol biopolymer transport system component
MSTARPLEGRLPEILEEISVPRTPAYFDDILGQVGRTRQRPGWSFPERWLPMTAISERVATAPRIPMRLAVAFALLLVALVVSVALIAGSQRPAVPAPFGVAGNGAVVFADETGAIRVGSVDDGTSTVIVQGTGHFRPVFSPDGNWLAYLQRGESGRVDIYVSGPVGEAPHAINIAAVGDVGHFGWTPDSRSVVATIGKSVLAFDIAEAGKPRVLFEAPTGSSFETLGNFNNTLSDVFRPPKGDEILLVENGLDGNSLYRQSLAGGEPITVLTNGGDRAKFSGLSSAEWSPDGSKIVLTVRSPDNPDYGRVWVVNADGTGLMQVSKFKVPPGYAIDEEHSAWSPDGSRIAFGRWINDPAGGVDVRPVVIVDLPSGEEHELSNVEVNGYGGWSWSPDGKSILQVPGTQSAEQGQVLVVDATTGEMHKVGWTADPDHASSWQRTVPAS